MSDHDIEQRLRAFAATRDDGADWDDVLRRTGTRFSPRQRRFAFALAATLVIAASVIGVLIVRGTGSGPTGATGERCLQPSACGRGTGPTGTLGPSSVETLADPLPGAEQVSLSDAESAFGGRIVLPDTPQASPSDVGTVWLTRGAGPTLGGADRGAAVTFPAVGVWVNYEEGPNVYTDDVLLSYEAGARQDPGDFEVIDLNGVPALAAPQTDRTTGSLEFTVGGVTVTIIGRADPTTMRAMAQSIVDRSDAPPDGQLGRVDGIQLFTYFPPARQVDVADASATLGAPVVLPDTSLVSPADVGQVWAERSCPEPNGEVTDANLLHACWIWVSFPSAGISVGYLRPPMYIGTSNEWKLQARMYGDNAAEVELGSVPALAIAPQDPYPGSVEFDLNGTRVVVAGNYDTATLQTVAQSIVDRAAG